MLLCKIAKCHGSSTCVAISDAHLGEVVDGGSAETLAIRLAFGHSWCQKLQLEVLDPLLSGHDLGFGLLLGCRSEILLILLVVFAIRHLRNLLERWLELFVRFLIAVLEFLKLCQIELLVKVGFHAHVIAQRKYMRSQGNSWTTLLSSKVLDEIAPVNLQNSGIRRANLDREGTRLVI